MPRNANPAPVHWYQGEPVNEGKLYFYESGTNTPKQTFADVEENTPNTHPVILDTVRS